MKPLKRIRDSEIGLFSNASINRKLAIRMFEAGMTVAEIAAEFPKVFYQDPDGKLGQIYEFESETGRKETRLTILEERVDEILAERENDRGEP